MISIGTAMLVGAICVVFQGFFSGSEIAIVSADKLWIRKRAQDGHVGAKLVEGFLEKPELLLATTLLGTNLSLLVFSVTVAIALTNSGGSELLAVAMVTPMTLIFGEVVPKTLFQQHANWAAEKVVYPLQLASVILRPLVWLVGSVAVLITRTVGAKTQAAFVTRQDLALLLESELLEDDITKDEREMINNVLELSDATVSDVMVPLSEVTALSESATVSDAAVELADKQHSRMPIFRSRVDDVCGILHVFDLLSAGAKSEATVGELARLPTFVPESKPAVDLLVELQGTGNHMAVVVDEYGGATGIVTVEDILEEIVGEIEDEYDRAPSPIRQERPGVWKVSAKTPVSQINTELGLELPEEDDYESVGGLLVHRFKRIPEDGESLLLGPVTLRVVSSSDRAVEEVQILRRR